MGRAMTRQYPERRHKVTKGITDKPRPNVFAAAMDVLQAYYMRFDPPIKLLQATVAKPGLFAEDHVEYALREIEKVVDEIKNIISRKVEKP